jgi:hypothetical protein
MDKDRQIRFLYSPLIFLGSILISLYFDKTSTLISLIDAFVSKGTSTSIIIGLLSATSLIPLFGYFIGLITALVLRLLCIRNHFNYEIKLSKNSYDEIEKLILKKEDDKLKVEDRFYAGVTFDHNFISHGVHQWIVRRWNSFYISSTSVVALILSIIVGNLILNVHVTISWVVFVMTFSTLLTLQGFLSWKETMRMIEFQVRIKSFNQKNAS